MVFRTEGSSSTINSFCNAAPHDTALQDHGKARAFSRLAGHFHAPAVMRDNMLYNRQANAGSRFARLLGPLGPVELLEDALELLGVHADALIAHRHPQLFATALRHHRYVGFPRRIFYGIGQKIV